LVVELARERTPDLCATGAGERSWQARLRTNQQKGGPASFMIVTVLRIAISRLEREDAPSTYAIAKIHISISVTMNLPTCHYPIP